MGAFEDVVAFRFAVCFLGVGDDFRDAEGLGVEWGLRDQAVGEGEPEDACDPGG